MDMLDSFLGAVYARAPKAELGSLNRPWFRVTTPDGRRNYPLKLSGNLPSWKDYMTGVAKDLGTALAWFDRGKFCLADGRRFSFGDLTIDRMRGGKPIPTTW